MLWESISKMDCDIKRGTGYQERRSKSKLTEKDESDCTVPHESELMSLASILRLIGNWNRWGRKSRKIEPMRRNQCKARARAEATQRSSSANEQLKVGNGAIFAALLRRKCTETAAAEHIAETNKTEKQSQDEGKKAIKIKLKANTNKQWIVLLVVVVSFTNHKP